MLDRFKREINYLRISVTDKCNLRCHYCMPHENMSFMPESELLSFQEIEEIVKAAVTLDINKIRLTGGEPLVRKNIANLVKIIKDIDGISEITMTSNGVLLDKFAYDLAKAGLDRLNISLDTIDPLKYMELTRIGNIEKVFSGIEAAKKAGIHRIKINCVLMKDNDKQEVVRLKQFAQENDLEIRFIHQMNLVTGEFSVVEGGNGGNCSICNRLRITANGFVKPCLFSNLAFDTRKLGILQALNMAINNKPACGTYNKSDAFYNLGG